VSCYAYRKGDCKELWLVHTLGVVGCIRGRWETLGLARKMRRLAGVSVELSIDYMVLAGLLHDIAKTFQDYQSRCNREGCPVFPKHWLLSSFASLAFATKAGIIDVDKREVLGILSERNLKPLGAGEAYVVLVVIPVLLHNYAHLGEASPFKVGEYGGSKHEIYPGCRQPILKAVEYINNMVRTGEAKRVLNAIRETIEEGEVIMRVLGESELRRALLEYSYTVYKAVAEAAIGILNMCDGRIARRHRRETCNNKT